MSLARADRDWLDAVRLGRPPGDFGHRDHLRLAWLLLADGRGLAAAQDDVSLAVKRIAEHHGVPQRYNRTVTDAWVRIVAHCRSAVPDARSIDELLAAVPWLLDKRLLLRHYSSRVLASDVARREWVPPDLAPIPAA